MIYTLGTGGLFLLVICEAVRVQSKKSNLTKIKSIIREVSLGVLFWVMTLILSFLTFGKYII